MRCKTKLGVVTKRTVTINERNKARYLIFLSVLLQEFQVLYVAQLLTRTACIAVGTLCCTGSASIHPQMNRAVTFGIRL